MANSAKMNHAFIYSDRKFSRNAHRSYTYDSDSINEKKDYMSMIEEFMQLQYDSNNLSGYLSYKELYDYINDRTER